MNASFIPALAAMVVIAVASSGCSSHSCTAMGFVCGTTSLTLNSPNDAWAAGTYTLALTMDGAPGQCTLTVPASAPPSPIPASCPLGAPYDARLVPIESCPPVVCNGGACGGMSCTPIVGRFQLTVTLQGLPAQVTVGLSRDGNSLTSEIISPASTTSEPNGAGCGTCTNASATVSVPAG
jgi:hypothetical protein